MKTRLSALSLFFAAHLASAELWTDNYDAGLAQAKAANTFVLLNFTGSDWCGWCKRLDAEVFSQPAFQTYAASNLLCVKIDFPRHSPQPEKLAARNRQLAQQYGVDGYPTIILLNPQGEQVAVTGYRPGGAEAYVHHIQELVASAQTPPTEASSAETTNDTPPPADPAE